MYSRLCHRMTDPQAIRTCADVELVRGSVVYSADASSPTALRQELLERVMSGGVGSRVLFVNGDYVRGRSSMSTVIGLIAAKYNRLCYGRRCELL